MNEERAIVTYPLSVDFSLLVVRVAVGVIFAAHGAQKLFGAFDGPGLAKTVEMMGGGPLPYLVTVAEFFGGLGLIFGFLSRFSAASLIVIMIGAIVMFHGQNGFFLSHVDPRKNGIEYNVALIGLLVPILFCGPGRWSIALCCMPRSSRSGRPIVVVE